MNDATIIADENPFDADYRHHAQSVIGEVADGDNNYSVDHLLATIRAGVALNVVARVAERYNLGDALLATLLGVSLSTLKRRRASNGRLAENESDRFVRVAGLYAMAEDVMGSPLRAAEWMAQPNRSLGQESPNAYAETDTGGREVEDLLGRIAHGVAA